MVYNALVLFLLRVRRTCLQPCAALRVKAANTLSVVLLLLVEKVASGVKPQVGWEMLEIDMELDVLAAEVEGLARRPYVTIPWRTLERLPRPKGPRSSFVNFRVRKLLLLTLSCVATVTIGKASVRGMLSLCTVSRSLKLPTVGTRTLANKTLKSLPWTRSKSLLGRL